MVTEKTARELFREATRSMDASYRDAAETICNKPTAWGKPCGSWVLKDLRQAKKQAGDVIRDKLPFEKKYDLMTIFNDFVAEHFSQMRYTPLSLDKLTERAEVEIELLKLMQGGTNPELNSRSRDDLAAKLHFTPDALKPYLRRLQNGKNLLGSTVHVELQRGNNVYDSTIHPVFLALNLTEVNFLVNHLRLQFKGTAYEKVAEQISYDVYRQLSAYATKRMDAVAANNGIDLDKSNCWQELKTGYRKELDQQNIPYILKAGKCKLVPKFDTGAVRYGRIEWEDHGYIFVGKDGSRLELTEQLLAEYRVEQV